MAKKTPSIKGLFEKTEPKEGEKIPDDIIKARGVGLKESEWAELKKIADDMGETLHMVSVYLLRYGLKEYKAGKIKPETKKTLPGL